MEPGLKEIKVELPADVLLSANIDPEHIAREMREALAYHYFATGRLSGGKAAKLAGMSRVVFLYNAHKHHVEWLPFSHDEVRREITD